MLGWGGTNTAVFDRKNYPQLLDNLCQLTMSIYAPTIRYYLWDITEIYNNNCGDTHEESKIRHNDLMKFKPMPSLMIQAGGGKKI
jgi:hypothetical protein